MLKRLLSFFFGSGSSDSPERTPSAPSDTPIPSAICPYCGARFETFPTRKRKCPQCSKTVFVKRAPGESVKRIVTEKEASQIEVQWQQARPSTSWLSGLVSYGVDAKAIESARAKLSKKLGRSVSDDEVGIELLESIGDRGEDLQESKIAYYELATVLARMGRDPKPALEKSALMELEVFEAAGFTKVSISADTTNGCAACRKIDGRTLSIADARRRRPLPCGDCTNPVFGDAIPFCRCTYTTCD